MVLHRGRNWPWLHNVLLLSPLQKGGITGAVQRRDEAIRLVCASPDAETPESGEVVFPTTRVSIFQQSVNPIGMPLAPEYGPFLNSINIVFGSIHSNA